MARQSIQVVAAEILWEAPASLATGQQFSFSAAGPVGNGSYLTLVPADSPAGHYEAWQWTQDAGDYVWTAPDQPGRWELRYVLGDGSTASSWPLIVH
ncbi:MAG: hypothetical protein EA418_05905 [Wenzhouxiangellaceae bacterium]|nr:MAG: hypothetical protein EA418_05905 [Wenzhouxiangellaceae bacterium]